jgi:hypothetical protein
MPASSRNGNNGKHQAAGSSGSRLRGVGVGVGAGVAALVVEELLLVAIGS